MRRLAALVIAACGVAAPARVDVGALVAKRGPVEAHRDLEIRILADPKDLAARLALAELDDRIGLPGEAIDQLVIVEHLGGPLGTRWHDDDRARLARLLVARARARLERGSPAALADLERARELGASVSRDDVARGKLAAATDELRHVDAAVRARGRARLVDATGMPGARAGARPEARGAFGAWAWSMGARREAYEQLAAWHAATRPPRDDELETAYLRALAWWAPAEAAPPEEATGTARCWFASAACAPPGDDTAPPFGGAAGRAPVPAGDDTAPPFGGAAGRAPPAAATRSAAPSAAAAARFAAARVSGLAEDKLAAIATAYARDPDVAERLGRELVAGSIDGAAGHAALGAVFDALGDPARARAHWQDAVDATGEPAFVRGLAEAIARAGDGAAALVFATRAAAASGDPAVVWLAIARALEESGHPVDALEALQSALELGDVETLPRALELAIAASRELGRDGQVATFQAQRARLAPPAVDLAEALAAVHALPTQGSIDRAWEVTRAHPREVQVRAALLAALSREDARRATLVAELVELAGDGDPERGLAAVRALRVVTGASK